MRAFHGCALFMLTIAACRKNRPFADGTVETSVDGGTGVDVSPTLEAPEATPAERAEPVPGGRESVGMPTVDGIDSSGGNLGGAAGGDEPLACTSDAGSCSADAGRPEPASPSCVPTGARDCTSSLDNDCDGQPDNTPDDVCRCVPGLTEACEEHPGLDGRGDCVAGSRTCVAGPGNASSDWTPCEGSVGPREADSCVPEDDGDCDGVANEGCDCIEGATQPCGPPSDLGICQRGTQTCVGGRFGDCVGATFPAPRDCRFNVDNDCNGQPDNTLDNVCQCVIGQTQACGQHSGLDGFGQCRAGTTQCIAGPNNSSSFFSQQCNGSVGPAERDCRSAQDNDCDGRLDNTCSDDPENSRCNNEGQCAPCQADVDCSLVSGGRNTCQAGECIVCSGCVVDGACVANEANPLNEPCQICNATTGTLMSATDGSLCSLSPVASCLGGRCDLPEPFDCNDRVSPALTQAPEPTFVVQNPNPVVEAFDASGGAIEGRYLLNSVESESQITARIGELIEFRDRDRAYRRMRTTYVGGLPSTVVDIGSYGLGVDRITLDGSSCETGVAVSEDWQFSVSPPFLRVSREPGRVDEFVSTL